MIKGTITYHDTDPSALGTEGRQVRVRWTPFLRRKLSTPTARDRLRERTCRWPRMPRMRPSSRAPTGPRTRVPSPTSGRFNVLVFDQGEPADASIFDGDGFSIDLNGGPYALYTRAGYIEGGNIQVDDTSSTSGGRIRRRGVATNTPTPRAPPSAALALCPSLRRVHPREASTKSLAEP